MKRGLFRKTHIPETHAAKRGFMMQRWIRIFSSLVTVGFFLMVSCVSKTLSEEAGSAGKCKDGVYEGKSQAGYTAESYWGRVTITVKKGEISALDFQIVDAARNKVFDQDYSIKAVTRSIVASGLPLH
jgi:uncharacterized protein with FMN-binding domain